jgi:hypothetical protein
MTEPISQLNPQTQNQSDVNQVNLDMPAPAAPAPATGHNNVFYIAGLVILFIVVLILTGIILKRRTVTPPPVIIVPSTPTPTAQVDNSVDPIATTSAFINLETEYSSLSASLNQYETTDPVVVPPVLDLTLGF